MTPSVPASPAAPRRRSSSILYTPASPLSRRPTSNTVRRPSSMRSQRTPYGAFKYRMSKIRRGLSRHIKKLPWWQRIGILLVVAAIVTGAILVAIFHARILKKFVPGAIKIRSWKAGWLIPFAVCYFSAFPPLFGYSTSITLAGFIYGLPAGWFIEAGATLAGSLTSFLLARYFFRNFAARMVKTDPRFAALSLTLKHDGLKLLCMIRLCPLPYSISNVAISSFPTVSVWNFFLATLVSTPKLAIGIFIGGRLFAIAESGEKMDMKTRLINYFSIIGGLVLGLVTGWIIYRRTSARARFLEQEERAKLERQALAPYSDEYEHAGEEDEDARVSTAARWIAELIEGDDDDDTEADEEEGLLTVDGSDSDTAAEPEDLVSVGDEPDKSTQVQK